MKTIKSLFTLLLLAASVGLSAQIHNVSKVSFTYIDLVNYTSFCREDIGLRVRNSILDGKLKVYEDKKLTKLMSPQEFINKMQVRKNLQIPNPQNPYDIYDLIDTVVLSEAAPQDFIFSENGGVEIVCEAGTKMYVGYKPLKKILDARLISILDYFHYKGLKSISDTAFFPFFKEQVKLIGMALYKDGVNGKLKPYQNDSLTSIYTVDEIWERVVIRENKSIPNPQNPNDWYDLIDTVIIYEFNPESIDNIRLYFEWKTKGFETKAGFFAIAPTFKPIAAGLELIYLPIFYIKGSDYLATLNKTEKEFWPYFYSYMLQNTSSGNEYDVFPQVNLRE